LRADKKFKFSGIARYSKKRSKKGGTTAQPSLFREDGFFMANIELKLAGKDSTDVKSESKINKFVREVLKAIKDSRLGIDSIRIDENGYEMENSTTTGIDLNKNRNNAKLS
jgi:hypothetical protein